MTRRSCPAWLSSPVNAEDDERLEKLVGLGGGSGGDSGSGREPLVSVSVYATVAGWTVESILRDRLWSRSSYALATAGALREEGFELLPT